MDYRLGIDVSRYQRKVNWGSMEANDIVFGFMRSSVGIWEDIQFRAHWALSRGNLLRGIYHYYLDNQDPKAQARKMFGILESLGDFGELPPALDIENINNPTLTASKIRTCLEEIERLFNRIPIIYTRASVWDPMIGNVAWAGRYPLWIAHYTLVGWQVDHIRKTVENTQPSLPRPWSSFAVWQITDKQPAGKFGITGTQTVDTNVATPEGLALLTGGDPVPVPSPAPDPPGGKPVKARVLVSALRLRSRPWTNEYNQVATLNNGEDVEVLETYEESADSIWHLVKRTDRRVGWAAEWHPDMYDWSTRKPIRGLRMLTEGGDS